MHTTTQLHNDLPELANNIRRSRCLAKAAVIATGPKAARTLVVTSAIECGEDYHLVHMLDCRPGDLPDTFSEEHSVLELRPQKWSRLTKVIKAFLAGDDVDRLCEVARG